MASGVTRTDDSGVDDLRDRGAELGDGWVRVTGAGFLGRGATA